MYIELGLGLSQHHVIDDYIDVTISLIKNVLLVVVIYLSVYVLYKAGAQKRKSTKRSVLHNKLLVTLYAVWGACFSALNKCIAIFHQPH